MEPKFSNEFIKKDKDIARSFSADSVVEKRSLGAGRYGDVFEVTVTKDGHHMDFAIKDYSKNGDQAKKIVERAYKNYLWAKGAGLKVFPTARITEDKPQLLLTLGTSDTETLISKDSHITWNKVDSIVNIKELVLEVGENVLKGSVAGMKMRRDMYFFLIKNTDPHKVDFLVGDYERPMDSEKSPRELFERNMRSASNALHTLIEHYISPEKVEECKNEISKEMEVFEHGHEMELH